MSDNLHTAHDKEKDNSHIVIHQSSSGAIEFRGDWKGNDGRTGNTIALIGNRTSMLKSYTQYIKSNPQEYWFKAKLYGWGMDAGEVAGVADQSRVRCAPRVERYRIRRGADRFRTQMVLRQNRRRHCYPSSHLLEKRRKPRWQWGPPRKGE